jgi:disulfide bond formation protein DsbB
MRYGLLILALIWAGSVIFGVYHSGVEWKWWPGPTTCTGSSGLSTGLPDLTKPVVMCDTPAVRILGLSLAGWNAVISLGMVVVAFSGLRRQGSSSVSQ